MLATAVDDRIAILYDREGRMTRSVATQGQEDPVGRLAFPRCVSGRGEKAR